MWSRLPGELLSEPARELRETERLTARGVWRIAFGASLLGLPSAMFGGLVAEVGSWHRFSNQLGDMSALQMLGVWVGVPALTVSATILFLAPGLVLAAGMGRARHHGEWLGAAFLLSLFWVSAPAALFQSFGLDMRGAGFGALVIATTLAAAVWVARRCEARDLAAPESRSASRFAWCLLPPVLFYLFAPAKFLWEDFNGDGVHALETARLLSQQALPFWGVEHDRAISTFPGMTSFLFAYPTSWYERLLQSAEPASRLPILLHLSIFFSLALAVAERGTRRLRAAELQGLWLGLGAYAVTMAFSATYSRYNADLAMPAVQDTMALVAFLGYFAAMQSKSWGWAAAWALVAWCSAPNGALLLTLWLPAVALAGAPRRIPWQTLGVGLALVVGTALAVAAIEGALPLLGQPQPGGEYATGNLASRFRFLRLNDWIRISYVVVPAGITTFACLPFWRRFDATAKSIWLITAGCFGLFYIQASASLHHFSSAMLLPMVGFWRWRATEATDFRWDIGVAAGALLAIALALPHNAETRVQARIVGQSISERTGSYDRVGIQPFLLAPLLHELYPRPYLVAPGDSRYRGAAIVWLHYGRHEQPSAPVDSSTNALLLDTSLAPPADLSAFHEVARTDTGVLLVREWKTVEGHLGLRPPSPAGSLLFAQDRQVLFRSKLRRAAGTIDLLELGRRLRGKRTPEGDASP